MSSEAAWTATDGDGERGESIEPESGPSRAERARVAQAMQRPRIFTVPYLQRPPKIDGDLLTDWPRVTPMDILTVRNERNQVLVSWDAALGYEEKNLYVAAKGAERTRSRTLAGSSSKVISTVAMSNAAKRSRMIAIRSSRKAGTLQRAKNSTNSSARLTASTSRSRARCDRRRRRSTAYPAIGARR